MPKESSFLLVSLKDQEAKKLAQVISSDTARKILDQLAMKKATETELANVLGIPLSTVHYNLKQLEMVKLIKADEFHYSEKGREVLHYSLANKYVIIAPEGAKPGILDKLKTILPVVVLLGGVSLALEFLKGTSRSSVARFAAEQVSMQDKIPMMEQSIAQVASSAQAAVAQQAPQMMAKMAEIAQPVAQNVSQNLQAAVPSAQNAVQSAQSQPSIALWFFLGAIAAIVLYVLIEKIRKR